MYSVRVRQHSPKRGNIYMCLISQSYAITCRLPCSLAYRCSVHFVPHRIMYDLLICDPNHSDRRAQCPCLIIFVRQGMTVFTNVFTLPDLLHPSSLSIPLTAPSPPTSSPSSSPSTRLMSTSWLPPWRPTTRPRTGVVSSCRRSGGGSTSPRGQVSRAATTSTPRRSSVGGRRGGGGAQGFGRARGRCYVGVCFEIAFFIYSLSVLCICIRSCLELSWESGVCGFSLNILKITTLRACEYITAPGNANVH